MAPDPIPLLSFAEWSARVARLQAENEKTVRATHEAVRRSRETVARWRRSRQKSLPDPTEG